MVLLRLSPCFGADKDEDPGEVEEEEEEADFRFLAGMLAEVLAICKRILAES